MDVPDYNTIILSSIYGKITAANYLSKITNTEDYKWMESGLLETLRRGYPLSQGNVEATGRELRRNASRG